jgi:hypothetical protein
MENRVNLNPWTPLCAMSPGQIYRSKAYSPGYKVYRPLPLGGRQTFTTSTWGALALSDQNRTRLLY